MREQNGHYHARTRYKETGVEDYRYLMGNFRIAKKLNAKSLNVHLPFEIQHPQVYPNLQNGKDFILFGEDLKQLYGIPLYWENAPEQVYMDWTLKHGQTEWESVPDNIELTLDTGHLIMGSVDVKEAQRRIEHVLFTRGLQIKHLHLHENDLIHDDHIQVGTGSEFTGGKVITETIFMTLTQGGRTYIFEKGIPDEEALKPRQNNLI